MNRNIFKYHVVCYYPNIFSREFVNIGILCGNDDKFKSLFLSDDYITMINCNYLNQKKKIVKELINNLKDDLNLISNINEISKLSLYFNNFKFSEIEYIASRNSLDVIIKDLFFQYIGYKFVKEEKKDRKIIIREKIIEEIDSNFKKDFDYFYNDEYFDLILKDKKKQKTYKAIIGSLFNEHDISRATTAYINSSYIKKQMIYSYFNSENEIKKNTKRSGKVLNFLEDKIDMKPYSFNEERINFSLEKLLL